MFRNMCELENELEVKQIHFKYPPSLSEWPKKLTNVD